MIHTKLSGMKKILVPTDFSTTAQCALAYARTFAARLEGAQIDVVHLYLPATAAEYPNIVPPIPEFLEAREKMLAEYLEKSNEECQSSPAGSVPVKAQLAIGFPADEIVHLSAEYDLIVMGTTGESDVLDEVFGSVSSHVARNAKCPVLLIPKGMDFKEVRHIMYASNYESADKQMIDSLTSFNSLFQATLHFVHVRDEEDKNHPKTKEEIIGDLFADGSPDFGFEFEDIEGADVSEALGTYAQQHAIDLVVMVARKRSFWESFFHRSKTKHMTLHAKLPLMVFHTK